MDRGDRAARRFAIGAGAFERRGKGAADGKVEPLVASGQLAIAVGHGLGPDQRHVLFGRQGAAAAQCQHIAQRGAAGTRILGQRHGNLGLAQEITQVPIIVAEPRQHARGGSRRQHVNRRSLANSVDRAADFGGNRSRIGRGVGGDQKDLILVNIVPALTRRQHRAHRWPSGVDRIGRAGVKPDPGLCNQTLAQSDLARGSTGQRPLEIDHEGLRIDPPPRARPGAVAARRRFGTRIAQGDHRCRKADGEAVNRAAARHRAARRGEHDLRRAVPLRGEREQQQNWQREL